MTDPALMGWMDDLLVAKEERERYRKALETIERALTELPYGATKDQKSNALFDIRHTVSLALGGDDVNKENES